MYRPLVLAGRPVERPPIAIAAPFDGRSLDEVAQANAADLDAACAHAASLAPEVGRWPAHRRAEVLRAVAQGLAARAEEIAGLICHEGGKPITLARAEVGRAIDTFNLCAEETTRIEGELLPLDHTALGAGRVGLVRRFSRGPVAAICPFNFPLNLVAHKVGPAIAAGCPVVVKPAEQTPSAALVLGEIVVNAGWTAISVVPCDRTVAALLVDDPRLPVISFTGSDRVGWAMRARAPRKQVVLELGGNAAVIVDRGADLAKAAPRIATGAYAHAGQVCISVQRVLAHHDVADELRDRLVDELGRVPCGDPAEARVVVGPMIDRFHADRVESWVREAAEGGATVHGGGREGSVLRPSLVENARPSDRVTADEVFGPTATLARFDDWHEAIAAVNSGRYGLQCGVFTRDIGKLWLAFEGLEVGGVIHDDFPTFRVDAMPYGGVKDSGVGREGPRWAIRDFTEERLLVLRP